MSWHVTDGVGNVCADGHTYYKDSKLEEVGKITPNTNTPWIGGGLEFSVAEGIRNDPRVDKDNMSQEKIDSIYEATVGLPDGTNYGAVCTLTATAQGIYHLNYTLIDVVRVKEKDENGNEVEKVYVDPNTGKPTYVTSKGSIPVYVISNADQTFLATLFQLNANNGGTMVKLLSEKISRTNLDKWYMPAKDSSISDDKGVAAEGRLYRGRTFLAFDKAHDYGKAGTYRGLMDTDLGTVDFTDLTAQNFSEAGTFNSPKLFRTDESVAIVAHGSATNSAGGVTIPLERSFTRIGFGDLVYAGSTGIAKLENTHKFVIGRPSDVTEESQMTKWVTNNVDAAGILDFNSPNIDEITFSNLDLSAASGIRLRDSVSVDVDGNGRVQHLTALTINSVTMPSCEFFCGTAGFDDDSQVKLIDRITVNLSEITTLKFHNFPNTSAITVTDSGNAKKAESLLEIKNVGNNSNYTDLVVTGPKFVSIVIDDTFLSGINLQNMDATVRNVTLTDSWTSSSKKTGITVSGAALSKVLMDNMNTQTVTIVNGETDVTVKSSVELKNSIITGSLKVKGSVNAPSLAGFDSVKIQDSTVDGGVEVSQSGHTTALTVSNISASTNATKKTVGVKISGTTSLTSCIIQDMANMELVFDNNSGKVGASTGGIGIYGCGTSNTPFTMTGDCYFGTMVLGDNGVSPSYPQVTDSGGFKLPKNVSKIELKGVSAGAGTIALDEGSNCTELVIGNSANVNSIGTLIGTLDLTEGSTTLKKLNVYGSSQKNLVGTIDAKGMEALESVIVVNEKPNAQVNNGCFAVGTLMLDNSTIPAAVFRNAIRMVGNSLDGASVSASVFSAQNCKILSDTGKLELSGGESKEIEVTSLVTSVKEEQALFFRELLMTTEETGNLTTAENAALKSLHSLYCKDKIQRNSNIAGGAISDTCKVGTTCFETVVDGMTLHNHRGLGIVILDPSSTSEKKVIKQINYSEAETVIGYAPTSKNLVKVTSTDENGNSVEKDFGIYQYTPLCRVTHLSAGINSAHKDGDHNDGCVLKIEYLTGNMVDGYTVASTEYLVTKAVTTTGNSYTACTYQSDIQDEHLKGYVNPTNNNKVYTPKDLGTPYVLRDSYIGDSANNGLALEYLEKNRYFSPSSQLSGSDESNMLVIQKTSVTKTSEQTSKVWSSAAADDRCENIDMRDSRIGTIVDDKFTLYDDATLVLALEKVKVFNADNCNLLKATVSTSCQDLTRLSMAYNRFGAISGGRAKGSIMIGANEWKTRSYSNMLTMQYQDCNYSSDDEGNSEIYYTTTTTTPNNKSIPRYLLGLNGGNGSRSGYASRVTKEDGRYKTDIDVTGVVTKVYDMNASGAPINYATWGGYDPATGKLNMPNLDGPNGYLNLYGNGIFFNLYGTGSSEQFSHAYLKCGYTDGIATPFLGHAAHYKDCSGFFSWMAQPSTYYGDYWTMVTEYSGDTIRFRYETDRPYTIGANKEWGNRQLGSDLFNIVKGKTVYFTSNSQSTAAWWHGGGEQIFPFGEDVILTGMFTNNYSGTDVQGGNLDWVWSASHGTYTRTYK